MGTKAALTIQSQNLEGSFRYLLAREGCLRPRWGVCLAHAMQRVSNIVGLTALRLAVFIGYR